MEQEDKTSNGTELSTPLLAESPQNQNTNAQNTQHSRSADDVSTKPDEVPTNPQENSGSVETNSRTSGLELRDCDDLSKKSSDFGDAGKVNNNRARRSGSYTSPVDESGHLLPQPLIRNGSLPENGSLPNNGSCKNSTGGMTDLSPESVSSQLRHRVCLEECVPSHSSLIDKDDGGWKMSLNMFSPKKRGKSDGDKTLTRSIRRYYKTQDELITAFEELQLEVDDAMETAEEQVKIQKNAALLAKVSFFANLLLLIGKAVAAGLSGSLAVISSVIDSGVDLVSGALMWWSGRAVKRRNIYQYPQGRTKLEPIAIVILSVVMSLASVQMIRESIEQIIVYATQEGEGPHFGVTSIVICVLTVVTKFILFLVCRRVRTPSVDALTQDHRNDVLSNTVALACGLIGDRLWAYADPIGAILISIYIMISWFKTGWEQIKMLTGHTARPDFLKKITWIALNHHPDIQLIDTVRAFHFGNNFLVEVDIVLDENMTMRKAHDIGESLQLKIERLTEVERAFVHLDYETDHSPFSEHKQV